MFEVRVTAKVENFREFCLDGIFWDAKPFVTKPGIVVHYYEPECFPKVLVCCLQNQDHSGGSAHMI